MPRLSVLNFKPEFGGDCEACHGVQVHRPTGIAVCTVTTTEENRKSVAGPSHSALILVSS
jgi:hypothetical protein